MIRARLPQSDVADQHAADYAHVFDPLIDDFLLSAFVTVLLHAKVIDLVGKAVECRHVCVRQRVAEVPVLRAGAGGVEENLVTLNQPSGLFLIPEWHYIRLQIGHEVIEMAGQNVNQDNPLHRALAVLDLRLCRGKGNQRETTYCDCDSNSLLHAYFLLTRLEFHFCQGPRSVYLSSDYRTRNCS